MEYMEAVDLLTQKAKARSCWVLAVTSKDPRKEGVKGQLFGDLQMLTRSK